MVRADSTVVFLNYQISFLLDNDSICSPFAHLTNTQTGKLKDDGVVILPLQTNVKLQLCLCFTVSVFRYLCLGLWLCLSVSPFPCPSFAIAFWVLFESSLGQSSLSHFWVSPLLVIFLLAISPLFQNLRRNVYLLPHCNETNATL